MLPSPEELAALVSFGNRACATTQRLRLGHAASGAACGEAGADCRQIDRGETAPEASEACRSAGTLRFAPEMQRLRQYSRVKAAPNPSRVPFPSHKRPIFAVGCRSPSELFSTYF